MNIIEKNYKTLEKMEFLARMRESSYIRMKRRGMKDLHLNRIRDDGRMLYFSISHYELDGDTIKADPNLEVIADWSRRIVMPAVFQDDYSSTCKEVRNGGVSTTSSDHDLVQELSVFLDNWLQKIEKSNYTVANKK